MSQRDRRRYSLVRAIRMKAEGKEPDGLEGEVHQELCRQQRRNARGIMIPDFVVGLSQRTQQTDTGGAGGFTVGTDVLGDQMIPLLRNQAKVLGLGVNVLGGLQGNIAIPKHTGGATAYWLAEGVQVPESTATFGQLTLEPHEVAGYTEFTKQLMVQSSIEVEGFVRQEIVQTLSVEIDRVLLNGSGAGGEPQGVLNVSGLGVVTYGGAPSWDKVCESEETLETANAVAGQVAWVSSPTTKKKWKTTVKVTNQAVFLLENDMSNGYPFVSTNQLPAGDKTIFGNWNDLTFASWDGLDVTVDPYTKSRQGIIGITVLQHVDCAVKRPASFVLSTDSAAQ